MKFSLTYSDILNGKFELGDLNLIMLFQVNCPGCFMYGFPLMNQLHAHYQERLSCCAMSTAFEDFELNTLKNTQSLVNQGVFVGETFKAHQNGRFSWKKIPFPILVDKKISQNELTNPNFIESIINNNKEWRIATETKKEELRFSIKNYFIQLPECGHTFAANLMQGTPTFILFNKSMDIQLQWFGHADPSLVKEKLDIFINKTHA